MARTTKTEYSRPDGWHLSGRLERKARPAGRIKAVVDFEMAAEALEDPAHPPQF